MSESTKHSEQKRNKVCSQCKLLKSEDEYYRRNKKRRTLASKCKLCTIEQSKGWARKNPSKRNETRKKWARANPEKIKKYSKSPGSIASGKRWRVENKDKIRQYDRERQKRDLESGSFNRKMIIRMRNQINQAIRSDYKTGLALNALGCSVEEFKKYITSLFREGMTWDNWGEWHLDHIRPLSTFDLGVEAEFKDAFHYSNFQPLWALENITKGAKCNIK